jgi:hypothetical protein
MAIGSNSYVDYKSIPSAIISDGIVPIPLWGVTAMSINEAYHFPPIGSTGAKSVLSVHDDTIALTGVLPGPERFAWKLALETLAESSKRGGTKLGGIGPKLNGLILITSMTIRTSMQIQSLSFSVSSAKRHTIDVTITLAYMPVPSAVGKLLDLAAVGVAALADAGGN